MHLSARKLWQLSCCRGSPSNQLVRVKNTAARCAGLVVLLARCPSLDSCCNTECCSILLVSTVGAGTCATRLPANFSVSYITRRIVNPPDTCCTPGCHSGELYMAHLVRRSVLRADSVVSPLVSLREPCGLYSSARVE